MLLPLKFGHNFIRLVFHFDIYACKTKDGVQIIINNYNH